MYSLFFSSSVVWYNQIRVEALQLELKKAQRSLSFWCFVESCATRKSMVLWLSLYWWCVIYFLLVCRSEERGKDCPSGSYAGCRGLRIRTQNNTHITIILSSITIIIIITTTTTILIQLVFSAVPPPSMALTHYHFRNCEPFSTNNPHCCCKIRTEFSIWKGSSKKQSKVRGLWFCKLVVGLLCYGFVVNGCAVCAFVAVEMESRQTNTPHRHSISKQWVSVCVWVRESACRKHSSLFFQSLLRPFGWFSPWLSFPSVDLFLFCFVLFCFVLFRGCKRSDW